MIYGTAWKKERTADLVTAALRAGFRAVDTAGQPKHYQEEGVGAALERVASEPGLSRSDLYIQTKFTSLDGQDPARVPYRRDAPLAAQVAESLARSLANLRTDHVDSLVLHSPLDTYAETLVAWRAMEGLTASGQVRALGVSNLYEADLLRRLYQDAAIKPAVVQNRFYPATGHDVEIRRFCREKGIVYQSFGTLTGNPKLLANRLVRDLARARDASPEQVLYRLVMQLGIVPLNGTSSPEHLRADLAVLGWEDLPADAVQAFRRLIGEPPGGSS